MLRVIVAGFALALSFCVPAIAQTAVFHARWEKNCFSRARAAYKCTVTLTVPNDRSVREGRIIVSGGAGLAIPGLSLEYPPR
jgi:hypothetical protein